MKIAYIRITPLCIPMKIPYKFSFGRKLDATVNLIEFEAENGTIGYGETPTAPDADAQKIVLERMSKHFVGHSVYDYARDSLEAYRTNFLVWGAPMPRYFNQMISGFEMAALDLQGKLLGLPVWDLLGGQVREEVGYFYILQGGTIEELAQHAAKGVAAGEPVFYMKAGLGYDYDLASVKAIREVIGDNRLRLDPNEAWNPETYMRMIKALEPYNVECIEQPTASASLAALKHVTQRSPIATGADQSVFTLHEVYRACETRAADMICVGHRDLGGLRQMIKAAAIVEGAGLTLNIHASSVTTGISTCAEHHVGRAIPNLDDGNQMLVHLLKDNIIKNPALTPIKGKLALEDKPGLGFDLDYEVVKDAKARHIANRAEG
jgi:muconate cycloisomerase